MLEHAKPHNAHLNCRVNGERVEISVAPNKTLLEMLREELGLTGTKHGCELGECGACAVLLDGEPVLSCLVLALDLEGRTIETIEGFSEGAELHPLQAAFADLGGAQCGYCTPAILVTAKALLAHNPNPEREQIREALSGILCRCTGYQQIFESVEEAILRINGRVQQRAQEE
jgi:aerobic-type carbon monoxide dehydrogenase small subunit (CoxS/CutS family)